jgi:hypothetical protein
MVWLKAAGHNNNASDNLTAIMAKRVCIAIPPSRTTRNILLKQAGLARYLTSKMFRPRISPSSPAFLGHVGRALRLVLLKSPLSANHETPI